jgi:hypothetical protein
MKRVFGPPHDFRTDRLAAGGDNAQLPGDGRDGLVSSRTHQPQCRRGCYEIGDAKIGDHPDGRVHRKRSIVQYRWYAEEQRAGDPRNKGPEPIPRHLWVSESELDGKVTNTKIGVMQVWQKQDGGWKLLARASWRLPPPA